MTPRQLCQADLVRRILTLDLPPGTEMDETRLAAQYGLSRTPLREIFRDLAGEGYVLLSPNRGTRVAPLDFAALRVFFRSAPLVHAAVARMAAEYRTEAQVEDLWSAQRACIAATETDAIALADHRFHHVICDMAANPYLAPSHGRLMIDHARLTVGTARSSAKKEKKAQKKAIQHHEALIEAIVARDPDSAVAVTLAHWDLERGRFDGIMAGDPAPDLSVMQDAP
ncbi:GntR family transcriptional regulator [Thetidibacter halocola]|uniref:GntR family transcriptional regulator n=1 Tax=Thetidibacter halocola TaxID=2827239 RepID=A0A8J7WBR3_9RHOB|nr:GntR family transcriptional regulator [Thetidibacter halocola]MBS0123509.1 GntR family transcriptional regulator [Thetidibacter halocola]